MGLTPLAHKYKLREGCEEILFISEIGVQRNISKSKSLFLLLLMEPNISEEVTPFHPFVQSPLNEFFEINPLIV